MELYKSIAEVLSKSQESVAGHQKLIVRLQKVFKEVTNSSLNKNILLL
jgi:hypothetical protein